MNYIVWLADSVNMGFYWMAIFASLTFLNIVVAAVKTLFIYQDKSRYWQVKDKIWLSIILSVFLMIFLGVFGNVFRLTQTAATFEYYTYLVWILLAGGPGLGLVWVVYFCVCVSVFKDNCKPEEKLPVFNYQEPLNQGGNELNMISRAIEDEYKSKAYKSEYKSVIEETPFISLYVTSYEIGYYKNDDYAKFLFHMYTKVLLDTGFLENKELNSSNKHPKESRFIKHYVHFSCFYLGYTILRQLILRLCHLSRQSNRYVNVNEIMMLTPSNENSPIFNYILDTDLKNILMLLVEQLDNSKFAEFYTLLHSKMARFEVELSNYNEKILKYAAINNKQLNKQLKQFVVANNKNRNRKVELRRKKILYIVSEIKFDIVVFDCIEEKYVEYLVDFLEYNRDSQQVVYDKYQKFVLNDAKEE